MVRFQKAVINSNVCNKSWRKKLQLTYAEAARWLLLSMDLMICLRKQKKKDYRHQELDGLEDLGIVEAVGHNLFETLMLNLVFDRMGDKWTENCPVWEQEPKEMNEWKIAR